MVQRFNTAYFEVRIQLEPIHHVDRLDGGRTEIVLTTDETTVYPIDQPSRHCNAWRHTYLGQCAPKPPARATEKKPFVIDSHSTVFQRFQGVEQYYNYFDVFIKSESKYDNLVSLCHRRRPLLYL
jgi:hypothetical protein